MSRYSEYFLNSAASIVQYETLEISHPSFSKTYYIVRNAVDGITATIEDSSVKTFEFYPLAIESLANTDDLDQKIKVMLGDLGEIIPQELDLVATAGTFSTKPAVIYRTFRSDDLTQILNGPVILQLSNISTAEQGASFEASAPKLNTVATGEIYSFDRFPMLRAFI